MRFLRVYRSNVKIFEYVRKFTLRTYMRALVCLMRFFLVFWAQMDRKCFEHLEGSISGGKFQSRLPKDHTRCPWGGPIMRTVQCLGCVKGRQASMLRQQDNTSSMGGITPYIELKLKPPFTRFYIDFRMELSFHRWSIDFRSSVMPAIPWNLLPT